MNRWEKIRVSLLIIIISISGVILLLRALYLEVYNKKFLSSKFKHQTIKYIKIKGERGKIFDKNGDPLALSIKGISVWVNPLEVREKEKKALIIALSNILGINRRVIKRKVNKKAYYVWIKRKISFEEYEKLRKLKIEGIHFIEEYKRVYPNKNLASHIIGFCNVDGVGIEGVEYLYNKYLSGKVKKIKILKDAKNNIISVFDPAEKKKYDGDNIYLTIDKKIQSVVEYNLREWIKKFNAEKGVIIVMNPETGEVISMASYPDFDPNKYYIYPRSYFRNLAINFNYEPGSTFKPIIVSYALNKKLIDLNELFYIGKYGYYRYKTIGIHDHGIYHWLNVEGILIHSSNIGMAKIASIIGKYEVYNAVKAFGFGEKTGINLPGESRGIVKKLTNFSSVSHITMSFGQGISVTPIQLITAYAAFINGGYLLKPYVVREIVKSNGDIVKVFHKTVVRRVISKEVSDKIKFVLREVVVKGTGRKANSKEIEIAGKTGTAQIASSITRGYEKGKYISSFIGFFPYDHPKYLMLMMIVKPKGKYFASEVVCPEFKVVAQEILENRIISKFQVANKKNKNMKNNGIIGLSKKEVLRIFKKKNIKKFKFIGEGFAVKETFDSKKEEEIVYFN